MLDFGPLELKVKERGLKVPLFKGGLENYGKGDCGGGGVFGICVAVRGEAKEDIEDEAWHISWLRGVGDIQGRKWRDILGCPPSAVGSADSRFNI
jgi:hypothetical protein